MSLATDAGSETETVALGTGRPAALPRWSDGETLGRYAVLETVGAGGMGVVLRAHDPELDRIVALKLLRIVPRDGSAGVHAEARLLREAQALARINHPHVIRVFDVGRLEAPLFAAGASAPTLFLAMEFVEGETLREWQSAASRSWREIVDVYLQAGRGLAAAHREGLLHRDFKPNNVLVDAAGTARVLDFGLARAFSEASEPASDHPPSASTESVGDLDSALTEAGTVMGTPPYMAPEQLAGQATTATDQYAFCVALYEALWKERPFGGSANEMLAAKRRGEIATRPRPRGVPRAVERAIVRGLAPDPDARFATMDALLDALRSAGRRSIWPGVVAAATCGVASLVLFLPKRGGCERGDARWSAVYDAARRESTRRTLADAPVSYAAEAADRTTQALDEHGVRWVSAHETVCAAAEDGELDGDGLDAAMACLSRRLGELDTVLTVLGGAGPLHAADIVETLVDPRECTHAEPRGEQRPTDAAAAEVHDAIAEKIHRAGVHAAAGEPEQSLALATEALAMAEQAGFAGLRGRALYRAAVAAIDLGDYETSARQLEESFFLAVSVDDDRGAANSAIKLAFVIDSHFARPADAEPWLRHADIAIGRLADDDELRGRIAGARGTLAAQAHDYERALAEHEQSLAIWSEIYADDNDALALAHHNIGTTLLRLDRHEEAIEHLALSLSMRERMFGALHPDLAETLNNLGVLHLQRGRTAQARELLGRAHAIFSESRGPAHPQSASVLVNLADIDFDEGHWTEALDKYTQAHRAMEATLGADNEYLAYPLTGIGLTSVELGQFERARVALARALEIRRDGPVDDPTIADSRLGLARALRGLGRPRSEWAPHAEAARQTWRARTEDTARERLAQIDALLRG